MRERSLLLAGSLLLGLCGCDVGALTGLLKRAPSPGDHPPPAAIFSDPDDGTGALPPGYLFLDWEFPGTMEHKLETPVGEAYRLKVQVLTHQESTGIRRWNRTLDYRLEPTSSASGTVDVTGLARGSTPGGLVISASLGSGTARVLLAVKPLVEPAERLAEGILLGLLPEAVHIIRSADEWAALLNELETARRPGVLSASWNDLEALRARAIDFTTQSVLAVLIARGYRESRPVLTHLSPDRDTVNLVIPGFHGYRTDLTPAAVPFTVGSFFSLPSLPENAQVTLERLALPTD